MKQREVTTHFKDKTKKIGNRIGIGMYGFYGGLGVEVSNKLVWRCNNKRPHNRTSLVLVEVKQIARATPSRNKKEMSFPWW